MPVVVVPAFDMYAATAAGVGARVVEVPLGPDFAFPVERILAAIGPQTRLLYLTSPNNPTGLVIPQADIVRIARRRRTCRCSSTKPTRTSRSVTLIGDPDDRDAAERLHRTHVRESLRAGGRARGRVIGDRETLRATQAHRAAVQPQYLRRRGARRRTRPTWTTTSGISARCGRRRPCSMRRSRKPGIQFLAKRRELRARSFRRPRAHRRRRPGGAGRACARQIARPCVPGLHPDHDGCRRTHRGVHPSARGGPVRRGVIERQTTETSIAIRLTLDGRGRYDVRTGVRFLDHMLELFTRHGGFDLRVRARGRSRRRPAPHGRGHRDCARRSCRGRARIAPRHQPRRLLRHADGRIDWCRRHRSRRPRSRRRRCAGQDA